ncbi:MAG: HD-GYP domain-containing protein [Ruminiclostridium sp.]
MLAKALNFFTGLKHLYIPEAQKLEFDQELISINFYRLRNLTFILIFGSIILLGTDFLNKQKGLWLSIPGYKWLFYVHLLLLCSMLALLPLLLLARNSNSNHMRWRSFYIILVTYSITIICTLISIVDQLIHGQITVYILGSIIISVFAYLRPWASLRVFLTSYLVFLVGITFVQQNPAMLRGHYINGTVLALLSLFLSIVLYYSKIADFLSKKTIECQKGELEQTNHQLKRTNSKLQESLLALDESQNIIFTLTLAMESKDAYTHGHSERVAEYSLELARYLNLGETDQVHLYRAAILHDIGKIGIPDAILNKPSILTSDEWLIMKSHPERGETICSRLNFTKEILPIIRHHHEHYDGTGYPDGLRGESIPFLARIVSIADMVDAITSRRPYRSARTLGQALEELRKHKGTQFDPILVEAFIELYKNKINSGVIELSSATI